MSAQLVVVGFDEIAAHKYLPCIASAISDGHLHSYSIIDVESERDPIEARLREVPLSPRHVHYLPDPSPVHAMHETRIRDAFDHVTDASGPGCGVATRADMVAIPLPHQ